MMKEAKPFVIDKTLIYKAYLKVKENNEVNPQSWTG